MGLCVQAWTQVALCLLEVVGAAEVVADCWGDALLGQEA